MRTGDAHWSAVYDRKQRFCVRDQSGLHGRHVRFRVVRGARSPLGGAEPNDLLGKLSEEFGAAMIGVRGSRWTCRNIRELVSWEEAMGLAGLPSRLLSSRGIAVRLVVDRTRYELMTCVSFAEDVRHPRICCRKRCSSLHWLGSKLSSRSRLAKAGTDYFVKEDKG